jgi:hypothetical protein
MKQEMQGPIEGVVDKCKWTLTGAPGDYTLVINGEMVDNYYREGPWPWAQYKKEITTLVIQDGVTRIADGAFDTFTGLRQVILPASVIEIDWYAFAGCSELISVHILGPVKTIDDGAFLQCYKLASVNLPDSVVSIGDGAFEDCRALTSVVIPRSLSEVGQGVFHGCCGLISVINRSSMSIGDIFFDPPEKK